jgi:hypothetical protein
MLAGRSRRRAAIVAGALAGVLTPLAAHAATPGLVISAQLGLGAAGATQTTQYLTPVNNNTDVPVYIYATVTGANSVTGGTSFQGFQYAFYNILDANAPGSGVGVSPTLDTTVTGTSFNNVSTSFNFAANGSHIGATTNAGILAGSTTAVSDIAQARSASDNPVWNTSGSSPNAYVSPDGKSVSYLIETLEVQPTAFAASTLLANGQNYSKISVSIPTSTLANPALGGGAEYQGANWNQDSTSASGAGSTGSQKNGTYSAAAGFVTFEDTIKGDVNGDGVVTLTDIGIVINNYKTTQTWAGGNFEAPGSSVVTLTDIGDAINAYKNNLATIPPTLLEDVVSDADAGGDTALAAQAQAALSAVPEPTSIALLGVASIAMLRRRRRQLS